MMFFVVSLIALPSAMISFATNQHIKIGEESMIDLVDKMMRVRRMKDDFCWDHARMLLEVSQQLLFMIVCCC